MRCSTPHCSIMTAIFRSPIVSELMIEIANSLAIVALASIFDRIGWLENHARLKRALVREVIFSGALDAILDSFT